MDIADRFQHLRSEIGAATAFRRKRMKIERAKAFGLKSIAVVMAAAITVLLGIKGISSGTTEAYTNAALVLGAAITVVNAWSVFFDPPASG